MSIERTLGGFFKPEMKSSGRKLLSQEKISISNQSETQIEAYVRVTPPVKVILSTENVGSTSFQAQCNCPAAKKNRFCKHIWAVLEAAEENNSDFLIGKTEIELAPLALESDEISKQDLYLEAQKQRAAEYRKVQYEKQKARLKEKKSSPQKSFSEEVEAALSYFSLNGFPMPDGPDEVILSEAKKKLSRLFHPDRGGTHEESVDLNRHCDVLQRYLAR